MDRPTLPLHPWPGTSLLAGKDVLAGGTWLGVAIRALPHGNGGCAVAALTNIQDGCGSAMWDISTIHSRGELVVGYLDNPTASPKEYVESVQPHLYPGFNLVVGMVGQADSEFWWTGNRAADGAFKADAEKLNQDTVYVMTNTWFHGHAQQGLHDEINAETPWEKVKEGRSEFLRVLNQASPSFPLSLSRSIQHMV